MKKISVLYILFILLTACHTKVKQAKISDNHLFGFVPANTSYIFKINKEKVFKNENLSFLDDYLNPIDRKFIQAQEFSVPFLINIFQKDKKLQSFVVIGKTSKFDSVFNEKSNLYNQIQIYKNQIKKQNYFGIQKDGLVFISNNEISLENIIRENAEKKQDSTLEKVAKYLDNNSDLNLICINKNISRDKFNQSLLKPHLDAFADIEAFDIVDAEKDIYSGIGTKNGDSFSAIFKNLNSLNNDVYNYIPSSFTQISRFSTDDISTFVDNEKRLFSTDYQENYEVKELFKHLKSATYIKENNNPALYFEFGNTDDFISSIGTKTEDFLSYPIYKIKDNSDINLLFDFFIPKLDFQYFTEKDGFVILTKNTNYLKKIINDIENANVLTKQDDFNKLLNKLPEAQHLANINKLRFNQGTKYIFKSYAEQDGHLFVNIILQGLSHSQKNNMEQLLSYKMSDVPVIKPQLVYNHKNKTFRIIYENEDNKLKYIDLSGKTLWQKDFKERIIGKIHSVDLYRNHKIQYAFVTPKKWYIIDRYGRNVEYFPKKIKSTKGLSVFDYDKNRKYRFGLTKNNKFLLYDSKGKKVKGFKVKTDDDIAFSPQHFRIGNKDFIEIMETSGKLNLLDRRGNTRIKVSEKFDGIKQDWDVYHHKFINFDKDNNLLAIDLKGKLKKAKITIGDTSKFDVAFNHFVVISDSKLLIDNKIHEIDLGNYSKPVIFKNKKKKVYIFVSNPETHKVFAYDLQGKKIKNFPIIGDQVLDVKELNSKIYLLVYDSEHNLVVYRF